MTGKSVMRLIRRKGVSSPSMGMMMMMMMMMKMVITMVTMSSIFLLGLE